MRTSLNYYSNSIRPLELSINTNIRVQSKPIMSCSFDPAQATFWLNTAHEFVQENSGSDVHARQLLQDFVTAEMLLEVYMRERHIPPHLIGGILGQRDELLRSLAHDRSYSFSTIARNLSKSYNDRHELEINLVVAMRALGFTASQISGPGNPDGLARYLDYPDGRKETDA